MLASNLHRYFSTKLVAGIDPGNLEIVDIQAVFGASIENHAHHVAGRTSPMLAGIPSLC